MSVGTCGLRVGAGCAGCVSHNTRHVPTPCLASLDRWGLFQLSTLVALKGKSHSDPTEKHGTTVLRPAADGGNSLASQAAMAVPSAVSLSDSSALCSGSVPC